MIIERFDKNPILTPNIKQSWEAEAVFNGCPIKKENKIFLVYRAVSLPHYHASAQIKLMVSDIGIAESKDGINFSGRRRLVVPEYDWERFGCEDPRITKLKNKYYIFYTALSAYPFRAEGIKIGLAITKDLNKIDEKHQITPFNAKAMALFPKLIGAKMWAILTIHTDQPPAKICLVSFKKEEEMYSEKYWQEWHKNFEKYSLSLQRNSQDHIEVGAPPIKTKDGWLLIYSYIQNYFSSRPLFTIEAVLLDLKNPLKIVAKTKSPLLTSEEYYEKIGRVSDIVFPSGLLVKKDRVSLYYGAADTSCCLAFFSLSKLLKELLSEKISMKSLWLDEKQIIAPNQNHAWEAKATFNPGIIYLNSKVHILYRAISYDNTSVFGYATSSDGINIDYRFNEPVYVPRESFEKKAQQGVGSGCEDPRLTKIGNRIYMCYTAYDGRNSPRVALTSISEKDFLEQKWKWGKPVLISPPDFDDKDACLFPEKIKGNYIIIHRSGDDIDFSFNKDLNFDGKTWIEEYRLISPRRGMWDSKRVGVAAPPIKTKKGWLILYHGISDDGIYRVGAVLSDINDPTKIIARTDKSIFEPRLPYEKNGLTSNVVFPCGTVVIGGKLFMYYGGADQFVGVATMPLNNLLNIIEAGEY